MNKFLLAVSLLALGGVAVRTSGHHDSSGIGALAMLTPGAPSAARWHPPEAAADPACEVEKMLNSNTSTTAASPAAVSNSSGFGNCPIGTTNCYCHGQNLGCLSFPICVRICGPVP